MKQPLALRQSGQDVVFAYLAQGVDLEMWDWCPVVGVIPNRGILTIWSSDIAAMLV